MFDRNQTQFIALTKADGSVAVMQFFTLLENTKTGESITREATDEVIKAEIDKLAITQPVVSWRRIDPKDVPTDRTNREAWRDDGRKIAVDTALIKPKEPTLEERIATLESSLKLTR